MTRDELIAMATEAGLNSYRIAPGEVVEVWERFAALVAAAEREACAVLLSRMTERRRWTRAGINGEPTKPCEYAAAIRARGAA